MRSHDLITGRSFGLAFDDGDDFFTVLDQFCRDNDVRQGYIPMFLAGFAEVELVGTCEKLTDPAAPVGTLRDRACQPPALRKGAVPH